MSPHEARRTAGNGVDTRFNRGQRRAVHAVVDRRTAGLDRCADRADDRRVGQQLSVWIVLALCAVAGVTAPLSYSAARTLVPRLVEDADLPQANAWLRVGDQVPMVLGAALSGPALGLLGPGRAFMVPLLLMLSVGVLAARLPNGHARTPRRTVPCSEPSVGVVDRVALRRGSGSAGRRPLLPRCDHRRLSPQLRRGRGSCRVATSSASVGLDPWV